MGLKNRASVAVLVVVSALFLAPTSAVAFPRKFSQPGDLITHLCSKTETVDICIATVRENIKGKHTGISVLDAEIDASSKATKAALAQVRNLSKSASKQEKSILSTCKENFGYAIDSLADAKTAIKAHDGNSLNNHLSATISYVTTCDDSYAEDSLPSPLTKVDQLITNLGSNCLRIANQIGLGVSA